MSSSRSFRLETRSRARDEIRKIVQTVDKVRKWEKKWVDLGLSNSIKVYKWMPVREDIKEEEKDAELSQDNQAIDVGLLSTSSLVQELRPTDSLPTNILNDDTPANSLSPPHLPQSSPSSHVYQSSLVTPNTLQLTDEIVNIEPKPSDTLPVVATDITNEDNNE